MAQPKPTTTTVAAANTGTRRKTAGIKHSLLKPRFIGFGAYVCLSMADSCRVLLEGDDGQEAETVLWFFNRIKERMPTTERAAFESWTGMIRNSDSATKAAQLKFGIYGDEQQQQQQPKPTRANKKSVHPTKDEKKVLLLLAWSTMDDVYSLAKLAFDHLKTDQLKLKVDSSSGQPITTVSQTATLKPRFVHFPYVIGELNQFYELINNTSVAQTQTKIIEFFKSIETQLPADELAPFQQWHSRAIAEMASSQGGGVGTNISCAVFELVEQKQFCALVEIGNEDDVKGCINLVEIYANVKLGFIGFPYVILPRPGSSVRFGQRQFNQCFGGSQALIGFMRAMLPTLAQPERAQAVAWIAQVEAGASTIICRLKHAQQTIVIATIIVQDDLTIFDKSCGQLFQHLDSEQQKQQRQPNATATPSAAAAAPAVMNNQQHKEKDESSGN